MFGNENKKYDERGRVNALAICLYDGIIPFDFVKKRLGKYWTNVEEVYSKRRNEDLSERENIYDCWRESACRNFQEAKEKFEKAKERLNNVESEIDQDRKSYTYYNTI